MTVSQWDCLVEVPREGLGPLTQFVPDTPWTTTTLQAIQNRKASVYVDVPQHPRNVVVCVRGGDDPGERDRSYVFGLPGSDSLRAYIGSVARTTEFVVDEELAPMLQEVHPDATPHESMCCWFDRLDLPPANAAVVPMRRLRPVDADAAQALLPRDAFRTFASPKDMILSGGCFAVELNGHLASIAYVADQSIKYARISVVTAEAHRRKGYGFAAARKLTEHLAGDGRLVCALVPRRSAPSVHFALKLGFPQKALLRTFLVQPRADSPAGPSDPASVESTSSSEQTAD